MTRAAEAAPESEARAALRARQGLGARYDAATAPHDDLLLVRRAAAYFYRKLNELPDEGLTAPSRRAGWSRARLLADVAYDARALAHFVARARTGADQLAGPSAEARSEEAALGASLPPRALRSLFHHTTIHLDVEWRDLPDAGWDLPLHLPDGGLVTLRATPRLRARTLWQAALDLGNGARPSDLPPELRGS